MQYNEIFKLKDLMVENNIPFDFNELFGGFHLSYPSRDKCICSVIEHDFSYGRKSDLLEIQGLMTETEIKRTDDTVLGFLTAENVFKRIKKHYKKYKGGNNERHRQIIS